jgi:hypothetical protein
MPPEFDQRYRMNAMTIRRFAFLMATGLVFSACAEAQQAPSGRVVLMCPDRSLRGGDIDLAVTAGRLQAAPALRRQMLERARSVCAANLSRVTLIAPNDASAGTRNSVASADSH